ncbi:reverse transcriptase domain-containing protein [Tanacetum coccineum]
MGIKTTTYLMTTSRVMLGMLTGYCYKEFLACNPKDFDDHQKVKYTSGSLIGKALTWWNTQVQTRGREAVVGMTWEDFKALMREEFFPNNKMQKLESEFWCHAMIRGMVAATEPTIIQSTILKAEVLTDKAIRNGSLKKNSKKRANAEVPSKDMNVKGDNKRSRTGRVRLRYFARDCRAGPKMVTRLNARNLVVAHEAYYECGGTNHYKAACPRLNQAPGQGGNYPNQALAIDGGQGCGNNRYPKCGRAFMIGVEEARQDPNIMTERSEENVRHLKSAKAEGQKLKDIVVVRNFSEFLGHVINGDGINVDPNKIEAIKNWEALKTLSEVYSFLEEQDTRRLRGILRCAMPRPGVCADAKRNLIMDEAHMSKYSVHPGANKMYYDLRDINWWLGIKKDVALYVSKCLTCLKVNDKHQRPSGLLQQPEIPEWKWERIAMDFFMKLPSASSGHDSIRVIVDRLTKFAHFLPMHEDYNMDKLADSTSMKSGQGIECQSRLYPIAMVVLCHGFGSRCKRH